jgi:hypothetical protein
MLEILSDYFDRTLRPALRSRGDDGNEDLPRDWILDELLPPILLLSARAAEGSDEMRACLRDILLPSDLYV